MAQESESSSYQGKKIGIVHNPQELEITEANWIPEGVHCASSQDE